MNDEATSRALDLLLDCICTELGDDCPCAVHLTAGPPVWDRCCEDCTDGGVGQLTGHVLDTWPYGPWPIRVVPDEPCRQPGWAVEAAVVLLRCHPTVDERGRPPTVEQLDQAARRANRELTVMRRAAVCCPDFRVAVTAARVENEPSGGCVGVGLRVIIDLSDRNLRGS